MVLQRRNHHPAYAGRSPGRNDTLSSACDPHIRVRTVSCLWQGVGADGTTVDFPRGDTGVSVPHSKALRCREAGFGCHSTSVTVLWSCVQQPVLRAPIGFGWRGRCVVPLEVVRFSCVGSCGCVCCEVRRQVRTGLIVRCGRLNPISSRGCL